jgi:error-prone DNA polymerase
VLPPDINASDAPYTGQGRTLRVGLMQIQGLGRQALAALLRARREGGPFVDFRDFLRRVRMASADVMLLVKAGCFDTLEGREKRPPLLWQLLADRHGCDDNGNGQLFAEPVVVPAAPAYDEGTMLSQERECLGMLLSCHPLLLHRRELARLKPVPANQIRQWAGRYVTMAGWWVTGKTVQDKDGRPMEFVSFEDTTALFDATFFPRAYERFCRQLTRHRPYLLKGKVEEEFGVATLNVEWVGFMA